LVALRALLTLRARLDRPLRDPALALVALVAAWHRREANAYVEIVAARSRPDIGRFDFTTPFSDYLIRMLNDDSRLRRNAWIDRQMGSPPPGA
jgi:hypothetical protein